jgi:hypothetical protein
VNVAVYAEGPTEWLVARKLWTKGILNGMNYHRAEEKKPGDLIIGGDLSTFLNKLIDPNLERGILLNPISDLILVLIDQESKPDIKKDIISKIEMRIKEHESEYNISYNVHEHDKYPNVFIWNFEVEKKKFVIVMHVANKKSYDMNKDFDGYIVELLHSRTGGIPIVEKMLNNEYSNMANTVHQIGEKWIPSLMEKQNWSIKRSKTIVYSHITAMQLGISHVHFSEKVVDKSDTGELQNVFASLIAAWNSLKEDV